MNGCEESIYMQDGDCIRKSKVRRATEKCEHYVNRRTRKSLSDTINELAKLLMKERSG